MKHIGVLTSGGDSPGMNAAIRAVVRTAVHKGILATGILHGYKGLLNGNFVSMDYASVSNIIQRGGTILKTSRCKEFLQYKGRKMAVENLNKAGIDGLIAIGGDGTFKGAWQLEKDFGFPVIGIPGTIDNDLFGTDFTIGYDTAINTVVQAVDKIRDTADAHDRLFFVEVMGRDAGLIALRAGIGSAAEAILIPETKTSVATLVSQIKKSMKAKKGSKIIMVAEGDEAGGALKISKEVLKKIPGLEARVSILGHIQRGGSPTCADRVLASRLGFAAVEGLLNGKKNAMVGVLHKKINFVPFSKAVKHIEKPNPDLLKLAETLTS